MPHLIAQATRDRMSNAALCQSSQMPQILIDSTDFSAESTDYYTITQKEYANTIRSRITIIRQSIRIFFIYLWNPSSSVLSSRNLWNQFQSVKSVRFCTAQRSYCCLTTQEQLENAQPRVRLAGSPPMSIVERAALAGFVLRELSP
nr:hypothetical protein orf10 [uncultured archaeon]